MQINFLTFSSAGGTGPAAAAIGVFDGVHRGHRRILAAAAGLAAETGGRVLAVTFAPHPRQVLDREAAPELLLPLPERLERLRAAGADAAAVIEFNRETAALEPEAFLEELRSDLPVPLTGIAVGEHWRFGRDGAGDSRRLHACCAAAGLKCLTPAELEVPEYGTVSSSLIRRLIAAGRLEEAADLLGAAPELIGIVEHGNGAASTVLGAPTANLTMPCGVLPPAGVYISRTAVDGCSYPALTAVGMAPTLNVLRERVECHLLDFSGDLYGRRLRVQLLRRLRPEYRFPDAAALKAQIAEDIKNIRKEYEAR